MKPGLNKENSLPDPEFGGESSESARAIHYVVQKDTLMTYEKGLFAQADPGIVSGSTIERKQMSTKTIYKRIALVAVASLGAGVLSVAPANANVSSVALSVATQSATVVNVADTITADLRATTGAIAVGNVITYTATISKPTGSALAVAANNTAGAGKVALLSSGAASVTNLTAANATGTVTDTVATAAVTLATATKRATVNIQPDAPGAYVVTITATAEATAGGTAIALTGNTTTISFTVRSLSYTTGDVAAATPFDTGTGIAGPANTVKVTAYSTGVSNVRHVLTVSGAGATIISATNTPTISTDKLSATGAAGLTATAYTIGTPQTGSIVINQYNETAANSGIFSPTPANTVTITVAAAAVAGIYAASTVYMNTSTTTPTSTSDATTAATAPTAASTGSNTPVANIKVSQVDAQATPANVATADTKAIVYEISGAGALGTANNQRLGSYIAVAAGSANDNIVYIYPDGRSGVGTVTVKVNGVLVSTKKVNFYGSVASYTAVVAKKHIANSGASTAAVVKVTAKDANGVVVPSATIYASAGTSTIGSVESNQTTDATGVATFAATGASAKFGTFTVTFLNAATAATATVTTTAVIGVSSVLAKTVTAKSDKATYAPGEKITWTMTFNDANGLGLPDGDYAADALLKNLASNPVASASLASTPFLGTAAVTLVAGVATATGYAPLNSGPVSYTWTIAGTAGAADTTNLVTALQATTVTASATVSSGTDISAITTLINSLIAKINALNKLVIKIQKKVRA
jgi:hypothetical protein